MPGTPNDTPDVLVDEQFRGKEAIRPLYELVRGHIQLLGDDVALEARQSYVAFSRGRQFAVVSPVATNRLDVGLVLPDASPTQRLKESGTFGSERTTHRISLISDADVDAEVLGYLRAAYEAAAS